MRKSKRPIYRKRVRLILIRRKTDGFSKARRNKKKRL
jgi:hypothetical protein